MIVRVPKKERYLPVISTYRVSGENRKIKKRLKGSAAKDNPFMVSPLDAESSMP